MHFGFVVFITCPFSPLRVRLPSGGETCNVFLFREESPGSAQCLVRERSSTTLCLLPSLRGPGLCGRVSYLLLSTLRPGPGLLHKSSSGTPGQWTPEALGQAGLPGSGMECPVAFPALQPPRPALRHVTSSKTPSAPEWGENHLCGALQRHDILRGRRSPRALERKKHLHAKAILAAAHSTSACACLRGHGRCLPDFELPGKPGAPQSPRRCPQTTAFFALIQDEVTSWKNQAGRWKERFPRSAWRLLPQWDVLRWGRGGASNVWS